MHLGMAECPIPFSGHCDLDHRNFKFGVWMHLEMRKCLVRVPTVREKSVKNEKSSRSGKSQGILSLVSEI